MNLLETLNAATPFKKGDKVILLAKGKIGTVASVNKAWEYYAVKFQDGGTTNVDFGQIDQFKKMPKTSKITDSEAQELFELLKNGTSPEEVASILRLPLDEIMLFVD
jgi:hypothetical protein